MHVSISILHVHILTVGFLGFRIDAIISVQIFTAAFLENLVPRVFDPLLVFCAL